MSNPAARPSFLAHAHKRSQQSKNLAVVGVLSFLVGIVLSITSMAKSAGAEGISFWQLNLLSDLGHMLLMFEHYPLLTGIAYFFAFTGFGFLIAARVKAGF